MIKQQNGNQEPNQVDLSNLPDDVRGIAAKFPDFAEIIAGANYDANGPEVLDEDPQMRYYLAASKDGHPAGVDALKQLGYRVSAKKIRNAKDDCVLMETPRALYDLRKRREQEEARNKHLAVKRSVLHGSPDLGLESFTDRRGLDNAPPGVRQMNGD